MNLKPLLSAPRAGHFLGVSSWNAEDEYDVIFLGCPVDAGMYLGGRSASGGPRALRQASQIYSRDYAGAHGGWFDYGLGCDILRAIRFADAGDLRINSLHPLSSLERLSEVVELLASTCRLVVLLGGDHSLTYWSTRSFDAERTTLLFLDAHEDATEALGPLPHSGNIVSYLDEEARFRRIVQFGLRGLVPAPRRPPPPSRHIAANRHDLEDALMGLSGDAVISLDVDVLDPGYVRAVASPSPGGIAPADVIEALRVLRRSGLAPRLLEIVEFAPETREDPAQAFLLVQLILRSLHTLLEAV